MPLRHHCTDARASFLGPSTRFFPLSLLPLFFVVLVIIALSSPASSMDTFYFTDSPRYSDPIVVEGQSATLRCDVNNHHLIRVHWTMNDKEIPDTPRRFVAAREEHGTFLRGSNLHFLRVDRNLDGGSFRCVATNTSTNYAIITKTAVRFVIRYLSDDVKVELRSPASASAIRPGSDVTLRCNVTGDPPPTVEWYKNGIRLFESEGKMALRRKQLTISSVTSEDNGSYSCHAISRMSTSGSLSSGGGGGRASGGGDQLADLKVDSFNNFPLIVDNNNAAVIEVLPRDVIAKKLESASFDCRYRHAVITEWYFMEEGPLKNNTKYSVLPNGTLVFSKVRASDEGLYKCVGLPTNAGPTQTYTAKMTVAKLEEMKVQNNFEPRFDKNPLIWRKGADLELRCRRPFGFPAPEIKWELPPPPSPSDHPAVSTPTVDGVLLRIPSVEEPHSGSYSCVASNLAGQRRATVQLKVVPESHLITEPRASVTVDEEADAVLKCKVQSSPYPTTKVKWNKNGRLVNFDATSRVVVDESSGELKFHNARLTDAGNYSCLIQTKGWPDKLSRHAKLYVKRKLKFNPKPVSTFMELGSNQKVFCNAEGDEKEPIVVKWLKMAESRSVQLASNWPSHITDSDGVLEFRKVGMDDGGRYKCVAASPKRVINATITLTVVVKPKFSVKPQNTTVKEGESVLIDCAAEGDPTPTISWDKNRQVHNDLDERFQELENGSLSITEVRIQDAGTYGCTAGNKGGLSREEVLLLVQSSSMSSVSAQNKFPMTNTIAIAVGCAVGYMALAVGLLLYCRHRRLKGGDETNDEDDDDDNEEGVLNRERRGVGAGKNHHRGNATVKPQGILMDNGTSIHNGRTPGDGMTIEMQGPEPNGIYHPGSDQSSSLYHKYEVIGSEFGGGGGGGDDGDGGMTNSVHSKNSKHSSGGAGGQSVVAHNHAPPDVRLTFQRQNLESLGMLGRGEFGDVFVAKARGIRGPSDVDPTSGAPQTTLVFVKSLLTKDDNQRYEFKLEVEKYAKLNHAHVASLLALCREVEPHFMIIEYPEWGDLKQYLLASRKEKHRGSGGKGAVAPGEEGERRQKPRAPPLSSAQKSSMIQQIASGMDHFAQLRFIHADLAARNILLTESLDVKIASPSLTKESPYAHEYCRLVRNTPLPIRWLPAEAIFDDDFSTKSDVYSFGVTCWEIYAQGSMPFKDAQDEQLLAAFQEGEVRLTIPNSVPKPLAAIMEKCWNPSPRGRPTFADIVSALGDMLAESKV